MIKYGDLVEYIKANHINWNTDLFDVLKGFFNQYYQQPPPLSHSTQQDLFTQTVEFKEPENGEYTAQDLMNLFST